jgi:hypothetical protein
MLHGLSKNGVQLLSCAGSQEGTQKDWRGGPVQVSVGEQAMTFTIYYFKQQLEKRIISHICSDILQFRGPAEHVACTGETINAYRIAFEITE